MLRLLAFATTAFLLTLRPASAATILPFGAEWEYVTDATCPGGPGAGWTTGGSGGCVWQVGPSPFSGIWPNWNPTVPFNDPNPYVPPFFDLDSSGNSIPAGTPWMPDAPRYDLSPEGFHDDLEDIWIRLRVDFQGYSPEQVKWRLAVDNGFKLYFEGNEVASATAGGFTWFWEYSGLFPAPPPPSGGVELLAAPSAYWVAISASDSGGATALAVELVAVPEPAALGLLGLGFAVVGYVTRRRRRLQ